ncbi:hypothetical protein AMATHDRAFT_155382 [Amanita thiersii Skay4041]|uniref:Telomere length regulation protein conserved domain-containing protein n=1 Tax=Amanita thiersii Skay4041 TaxID=703135 RepID=A0A2A9NDP9_9AGAR|nr:hypothetical protein AMATHDRAFT_155382 [Amanita thiersii Skay4041]
MVPNPRISDIVQCLQTPIHDLSSLLSLLAAPLNSMGLLPKSYTHHDTNPLSGKCDIPNHVHILQRVLLQHIVPTWQTTMKERGSMLLLDQYFCPINLSCEVIPVWEIVMLAYSTICSLHFNDTSIRLLQQLSIEYPISRLCESMVFCEYTSKQETIWEDYVNNILSLSSRIGNARMHGLLAPDLFDHANHLNNLSIQCEELISRSSRRSTKAATIHPIVYLVTKLANHGAFPPTLSVARSQPSFFAVTLSAVMKQLKGSGHDSYANFWSTLINNIPSSLTLRKILQSLFVSLPGAQAVGLGQSFFLDHGRLKEDVQLLRGILGAPDLSKAQLWECAMALVMDNEWSYYTTQVLLTWISGDLTWGLLNLDSLRVFMNSLVSVWTSTLHIRHSSLSKHRYLTTFLLLVISRMPRNSPEVQRLITLPSFIKAVGSYVSHLDPLIRICGMLTAEIVASMCGRVLNFNSWEGNDEGRIWARHIRQVIETPNEYVIKDGVHVSIDIEPTVRLSNNSEVLPNADPLTHNDSDSDDSVVGYDSSLPSRSSSPELDELSAIETDPSLNTGVQILPHPVYLYQLCNLIRNSSPSDGRGSDEFNKIDVALTIAERLIRTRDFVKEENAPELVRSFLGLQNHYDLSEFDARRQRVLNTLVACCPHQAAPCLIEELFKDQYSISQRFSALNAVSFGAQELNTIPSPPSPTISNQPRFPHNRSFASFLTSHDTKVETLEIMDDVPEHTNLELDAPRTVCSQWQGLTKSSRRLSLPSNSGLHVMPFTLLGSTYFILPLINRFWLYLRDGQTRQGGTMHLGGRSKYCGAGTGLLLSPLVLAQFLRTLAALAHTFRNATDWLAIIAPEALELAVTIGMQQTTYMDPEADVDNIGLKTPEREDVDALVLTAVLELILVILENCVEKDGGKYLCLYHMTILFNINDWASGIFSRLNQGYRPQGGGSHETKLLKYIIAVLHQIDSMQRWLKGTTDSPLVAVF